MNPTGFDSMEVFAQVAKAAAFYIKIAAIFGEPMPVLDAYKAVEDATRLEWEAPRKDDEE